MDDPHRNGLYRWKRQTKPVVQSRSHRVASTDDIQDWIKKVEDASTRATDVAFGLVQPGHKKGKALAQQHSMQVRAEEEAHLEAQDLLRQWVTDKICFDDDDGFDDLEAWRRARNQQQEKRETSDSRGKKGNLHLEDLESAADILNNIHYSDDDLQIDEAAIYERVKKSALGEDDPYAHLYDLDEQEAVSSVLKTLLSKEVVKETFKRDLGVGENAKTIPDPRTRMELRHQMVKENREKRHKEEMKRLKERQIKKEARMTAQQMINKEQKDKEALVKKEEEEIKKEMAKLRKDLVSENKKKEESLRRQREEREMMERLAREELERQKYEEEREQIQSQRVESERRKTQMVRREMWRAKQEAKDRKCLHLHFTAWYDLVLSQRLQLGKVKAMSDWKLTVRVWGAWKSYVRGQRAQEASVQHEKQVIESHRNVLCADTHYRHRLLWKCLNGWKYFVTEEVERREMEEEKNQTKNKMLSLLNAVAEGRLVKEGRNGSDTDRSRVSSGQESTKSGTVNDQRVRDWVLEEDVQSQCSEFTTLTKDTRPSSAMSSGSRFSRPSSVAGYRGRRRAPTEAWQVTKRHTKLDKEELRNIGQGEGNGDVDGDGDVQQQFTDAQIRKRFGTQPWMNRHYVVNNFENRYNAQQRALRQQQEEIHEQKRLIQDLQFQQEQQRLQQQLATGVVSPAPPKPVQAPPKGREIPRDTTPHRTDPPSHRQTVVHARTGGAADTQRAPNNLNGHKEETTPTADDGGHSTDRSCLSTQRTASDASRASSSNKSHNAKYLQVLKNMEDRSAQRARQKAEREEKRRKQEEEKLAQLEKQEAERLREIEEEKRARVEAFKQKKRLEKQKEEERQREATRQQELVDKAKTHYERSILKYRGLLPLKKLISLSKRNWNIAVRQHNQSIMRQCLREWGEFAQSEIQRKNDLADQMGQFLLVKHCFDRWRKHKHHTAYLLRRADRHYESSLRSRAFTAWREWRVTEQEEVEAKMIQAEEYYWDHLLRSRFMAWRFLPQKLKKEDERKKRKLEMRRKVAELIPDFAPRQSVTEQGADSSHEF